MGSRNQVIVGDSAQDRLILFDLGENLQFFYSQ